MIEIFITTNFIAFHKWNEAPKEVEFLKNLHRHIFYVKVFAKVQHNNRDKEFFIFKNQIDDYIKDNFENKEVGSCEMIAQKIADLHYDITRVEVSEDNENGAIYYK